ncbi:hypothetical protein LUZ61_004806 [Rhynchospora tenuis]|uniref:non-specific serine/threonine protein kinase n=1 Tax=Rhynchospora tenuis TaxID=198213 RepID=A0AAD5ZNE0_9POAL|nr:hypothetical protein LUZ61_004806 [Rhynchospora tenuis]
METLSFTIMFLCAIHLSYAKNILYPGESLFPNQSLVSNSSEFKFGFFTAGGPSNFSEHGALYYYIGVWLADTVSQVQPPALDDTSGVAWVGNRENPVVRSLPSELSLSNNGDLILTQSQKLIWSSNATQAEQISDTVLLLLDTGNLVLCDRTNSNKVIWQSFYHPANTWFPGAGIGFTNIDGENKELDFSRALTTIKGTVGYLAPEWYSGEAITQRADVYSFGMMLFEIISGKRNSSEFNNKRYPYFPLYATVKMNEGEVLCLLDEKLGGNVDVAELIRACKVAGWCIQEPEACRPSMKKVVLMLKGTISVGIPPVPKSLLNLVDADDY